MPRSGTLLCLGSAAAFGAMGIFGKLAYEEGATVGTLLAARFAIAAAVLWVVILATGRLAQVRALSHRDAGIALALGGLGYGAQAGAYFVALGRLDASLLALLVYTFPTLVTVTAIVLGRDRFSPRIAVALVLASTGLVLMLATARDGALDPLGTVLGLSAAVMYTVYILASEGITARVGPLALTTLVCTGAAVSLTVGGILVDDFHPAAVSVTGAGWLTGIAVISTVGGVALFFAGLHRAGPSTAAILSTLEPVVTVVLAFLVFGESLGTIPLAGGVLVLLAVLVVRAPRERPLPTPHLAPPARLQPAAPQERTP